MVSGNYGIRGFMRPRLFVPHPFILVSGDKINNLCEAINETES